MTKDQRLRAMNLSYEAMLYAQMLMDVAATTRERGIAAAIYEAHNALYWLLDEERKQDRRQAGCLQCKEVHGGEHGLAEREGEMPVLPQEL